MDYSKGCPYFKLNKFLLTCIGLWPYQSNFSKYFNCLIFATWTSTAFVAMALGLTDQTSTDSVIFSESLATLVTIGGDLRQWIFLKAKAKTIECLLNRIERDWGTIRDPKEMAILKKLSQKGKLLTIIYFASGVISYAWFLSLTYIPQLLNESNTKDYSKIYPYYSHRWIINKNFRSTQAFLHASLGAFFAGFMNLASTSFYICSAMHICAMYAIVSHRLRNLMKTNEALLLDKITEEKGILQELFGIISTHKEAIESVHILHRGFSNSFFVAQIFSLLSLPMLIFDFQYQIDKSGLSASRVVFIIALFAGYVFYINLGGQLISDHSNRVLTSTYFMHWYLLPKKAQRILLMIIMRSNKADCLNNGIMTLSLQNFTTIIKVSWSFAAVLLSMQRKKAS